MKTAICYFTGTGNSLYAGQTIAQRLGDCQFYRMADVCGNPRKLEGYERIGLCFPVYGFGLPRLVRELIGKLEQEMNDKYFFAVLTCAGFPGSAAKQTEELFEDNGVSLSYICTLTMPDSFSVAMPVPSERSVEATLRIAERSLAVIAADIAAGVMRPAGKGSRALGAVHRIFMSDGEDRDRKYILTAACDGCGLCAALCPADNIAIRDGKPEFLHHCEFCMGCFHRCPRGAINYGRKTIKKRRYVNPRAVFFETCD